ncbi:hypothetical protein YC2023_110372 [Brassica napus]
MGLVETSLLFIRATATLLKLVLEEFSFPFSALDTALKLGFLAMLLGISCFVCVELAGGYSDFG